MSKFKTKKLVVCALFAAICFVVTRFLSVPALYTKGYVNLGDLVVLLCAFVVGGWQGSIAAAPGASLADASMGYWVYVPATFIIKAAMVFASSYIFKKLGNKGKFASLCLSVLACVLAESIMVFGYFIYESVLYNSFAVAFASVVGNIIQATVCMVPTVMLITFFKNNSAFAKFVKSLHN